MNNKKTFNSNMAGAKQFQNLTQSPESDFWMGYQRGLRKLFHGENFGTDAEHTKWLALVDEQRDMTRRNKGLGYQAGLEGTPISELANRFSDEENTTLNLRKFPEILRRTIHSIAGERGTTAVALIVSLLRENEIIAEREKSIKSTK